MTRSKSSTASDTPKTSKAARSTTTSSAKSNDSETPSHSSKESVPSTKTTSSAKKTTAKKTTPTAKKTTKSKTSTKATKTTKTTTAAKTTKANATAQATSPSKSTKAKKASSSDKAAKPKATKAKTQKAAKPKAKTPTSKTSTKAPSIRRTKALLEKAEKIREQLEELYPETPIPLNHTDSYTLLIGVLLSAQCTDVRVNQVTPSLFAKASTPQDMVELTTQEIEEIIRPCGLSDRKSKAIWNLSRILLDEYEGQVPESLEEMETLPGVGHKTASVVMVQAFGKPAFPIDTHIHRLAQRWGLSQGSDVVQTEVDLKSLYPEGCWGSLHLRIIFFGREYCPARGHDPEQCPICSWATV